MMEINERLEWLQQFILDQGLPRTDIALFGILCPYCGKSDRIRKLDHPEDLRGSLNGDNFKKYNALWNSLTQSGGSIGACKFCQHLLKIDSEGNQAEALWEFPE